MPLHWEKQHIKLGEYDRRKCGLTDEDKEQIKYLHKSGVAIRQIARDYAGKCSRRLISFILFPERLRVMQERNRKEKHWKKYYNRKDLTKAMREWRQYKTKLIKAKKI